MLPVFAIVGRPNVGKSTLFNRLTHSRQALVADIPGVTRDRQYGKSFYHDHHFMVIDTGGMDEEKAFMSKLTAGQTSQALEEADCLLWLVDASVGCNAQDAWIAEKLRLYNKPVYILINKIDGVSSNIYSGEFSHFGWPYYPISALRRRGLSEAMKAILNRQAASVPGIKKSLSLSLLSLEKDIPKLIVMGRPNVGKSTLVNQLVQASRMLVSSEQGTTRDTIATPFNYQGIDYSLIDTPGVRRKSKVRDQVEKYSMIQTIKKLHESHMVIFLMDVTDMCTQQDLRLLRLIMQAGKPFVIGLNKCDQLLTSLDKSQAKQCLSRKLPFLDYIDRYFVSAKQGYKLSMLMRSIQSAYQISKKAFKTGEINRILQEAIQQHPAPQSGGRRIKIRYAHKGGVDPLTFVIHGNQVKSLPEHYQRYLEGFFRKKLGLTGVPLQLLLKNKHNPYIHEKSH